jgi:hypothetical protein
MALMLVMVLSLVILTIVSGLLYFATTGTMMSGIQKRYTTAQEAAKGAIELFPSQIIKQAISGQPLSSLSLTSMNATRSVADQCFANKLRKSKSSTNWTGCSDLSLDVGYANRDVTFVLNDVNGNPSFNVHVKIVDTVEGNSDVSGLELDGLGVVENGGGMVAPPSYPYLYRIEVNAEKVTNARESANFDVFYAY